MKYAIVESGGKQYRAVEGGTLEVDRLNAEVGANLKLEQVLLLAEGENVTVGTPFVKDSPVWTTVVDHFKGKKVTIFNYSPKKRIRVKTGHRQTYTRLLVEQIGGVSFEKRAPVQKPKRGDRLKAEAETVLPETVAEKVVKEVKEAPPQAKKPAARAVKAGTPKIAEKKPAARTVKAATSKTAEKKPAARAKPAAAVEKKPAKAAPKPAARKTAAKKPAEPKE